VRTALDVHRDLLARDVPHEIVRLRQRVTTSDELPDALDLPTGCLAVRVYAAVRAGGRTAFVAVVVPAGAVPDPAALLGALGADSVRLATAAEVNAATDYPAELVSPVGLPADVEVLVDAAVGGSEVVYTAAGEGGVALGVRTRDLLVAVGAKAATLTPVRVPLPEPRYADIVDLDVDIDVALDVPIDVHAERRAP
jgi:Cys-tRNA(Pro)/Cys-tRNA(Cys) deacylase